ncbi:hypothetical protein EPO15_06805, partial [bacterium]
MKKALSTFLSAAVLLVSPGSAGWAQVVRTAAPVRTAPAVGGLGVSGAVPTLAPLAAPSFAAPTLSLPAAAVPMLPTALPSLSAPSAAVSAAPAVLPLPLAGEGGVRAAAVANPHPNPLPQAGEGNQQSARTFAGMLQALSLPGLVAPQAASDAQSSQASADFSMRLGGAEAQKPAVAGEPTLPAGSRLFSGLAKPGSDAVPVTETEASNGLGSVDAPLASAPGTRHRSVYFPLALAALSAVWFAGMAVAPYAMGLIQSLAPAGLSALTTLPGPNSVFGMAASVLFAAAGTSLALSAVYAAWEAVLFTV